MTRIYVWASLILVIAGRAHGQPPIPPPTPIPTVTIKITGPTSPVGLGEPIIIKADTTSKKVSWRKFPSGATVVPSDGGKELHVWCKPGSFVFGCAVGVSADGEAVHAEDFTLTVTGDAPAPADPLTDTLQKAYGAEANPAKYEQVRALAKFYAEIAPNIVADKTLDTRAKVLTELIRYRKDTLPDPELPKVRAALDGTILDALGSAGTTLTDAGRDKAKAAFTRIAVALTNITK